MCVGVLAESSPSEGAADAGDGTGVPSATADGTAPGFEFTTLDGRTAAVVTVEASDVRPVSRYEITHARTLAS